MKTRGTLAGLVLAVVAALVLFDLGALVQASRLNASLGQRPEMLATLNRRLQAGSRAAAARSAAPAGAGRSGGAGAERGVASSADGSEPSKSEAEVLLAKSPELRARFLDAYRGSQGFNWALFFDLHNLPAGVRGKLLDLMAQREADEIQVAQEADDRGLSLDSREIRKLSGQQYAQNQAAIAALLSPEDFAAYQQYSKDTGVAPAVIHFAGSISATAEPLSADEGAGLTQVLADASQRTASGWAKYGTIDAQRAVAGAAAVLNQNQVAALSAYLEKAQATVSYKQLSGDK